MNRQSLFDLNTGRRVLFFFELVRPGTPNSGGDPFRSKSPRSSSLHAPWMNPKCTTGEITQVRLRSSNRLKSVYRPTRGTEGPSEKKTFPYPPQVGGNKFSDKDPRIVGSQGRGRKSPPGCSSPLIERSPILTMTVLVTGSPSHQDSQVSVLFRCSTQRRVALSVRSLSDTLIRRSC